MFETIDFVTREAEDFANYWAQLPRTGQVPSRKDFDPTEIAPLLPGISMYEFRARDDIRVRLSGTLLVETFGEEITGTNYLDKWPEEHRAAVGATYEVMLTHPCGLFVAMEGLSGVEDATPSVSVGFPMRNPEGVANLLLFHTSEIDIPAIREPRDDPLTSLRVTRRALLDIGAGLPDRSLMG
jgi:hypothetical protein